MEAPGNVNVHHMLWRYSIIKMCNTWKSRMVCDGSPCQGTITLDHSFASTEGILYWREKPHPMLPEGPTPTIHTDNYDKTNYHGSNSKQLVGVVDSDWATNTKKQTSLTGLRIMFAGRAIGYKSKFQCVIAHSSTEAKFVAACHAAKLILFYRSLMKDVGMEQQDATILFKDNNGALLMAHA